MSHILGLDDDRLVSEVMLGFIIKFSQSEEQIKCLNFDEFLVDKIHSQLMIFHTEKCFRYQTMLLLLIIHANLVLEESTSISFLEFTNKIMAKVYYLFFKEELPRVSEEMRNKLQLSTNPIGDWFLFRDHMIIRVYGFIGTPYILPTFMTSSLFSLEYIRQRLFTKKEQSLKAKKGCNIKFHYAIGPFVIK